MIGSQLRYPFLWLGLAQVWLAQAASNPLAGVPYMPWLPGDVEPEIERLNEDTFHIGGELKIFFQRAFRTFAFYTDPVKQDDLIPEVRLVFGRLVEQFSSAGPHFMALRSLKAAEDGSSYRLSLRPEVEFYKTSPGSVTIDRIPATAEDLLFSLESYRNYPWIKSSYTGRSLPIAKMFIEGQDVVITIEPGRESEGRDFLLGMFVSTYLVPKSEYEGIDVPEIGFSKVPVGSGPYIVRSADTSQGSRIVYERVKDHWLDRSHPQFPIYQFQTIHFELGGASDFEDQAFRAGLANVQSFQTLDRPTELLAWAKSNGRKMTLTETKEINSRQHWIRFHGRVSKETRMALALAAPLAQELKQLDAFGTQSRSIVSLHQGRSLFQFTDTLKDSIAGRRHAVEDDPRAINSYKRRVLREIQSLLAKQSPRPSRIILLIDSTERWQEAVASRWIQSLKTVGIDVETKALQGAQLVSAVREGDFDMGLGSLFSLESPRVNWFASLFDPRETDKTRNAHMASHSEIEALIDGLLAARQADDIRQAIRDIEDVIARDVLALPIADLGSEAYLLHPTEFEPAIKINGQLRGILGIVVRDWRKRP